MCFVDYPTSKERLAVLRALLRDIQQHQQEYNQAELVDITTRLTSRIAELEREVHESESANLSNG